MLALELYYDIMIIYLHILSDMLHFNQSLDILETVVSITMSSHTNY